MKARPILFNTQMVQALLSGKKTMTRRVIKKPEQWTLEDQGNGVITSSDEYGDHYNVLDVNPFGEMGDLLYVRETWQFARYTDTPYFRLAYKATPVDAELKEWKPSIHMPRQFSRLTLKITDIKVEKLEDISRGDAMAEGCPFPNMAKGANPVGWFKELWQSINGANSWDNNPYVWCVEFQVIKQNVDEYIKNVS